MVLAGCGDTDSQGGDLRGPFATDSGAPNLKLTKIAHGDWGVIDGGDYFLAVSATDRTKASVSVRDSRTGRERWRMPLRYAATSGRERVCGVGVGDDRLIITGLRVPDEPKDSLRAWHPVTGKLMWQRAIRKIALIDGILCDERSILVRSADDPGPVALDPSSGELKWRADGYLQLVVTTPWCIVVRHYENKTGLRLLAFLDPRTGTRLTIEGYRPEMSEAVEVLVRGHVLYVRDVAYRPTPTSPARSVLWSFDLRTRKLIRRMDWSLTALHIPGSSATDEPMLARQVFMNGSTGKSKCALQTMTLNESLPTESKVMFPDTLAPVAVLGGVVWCNVESDVLPLDRSGRVLGPKVPGRINTVSDSLLCVESESETSTVYRIDAV